MSANDALQVAFLCIAAIGAIGIFLPIPALGLGTRWRGFMTFLLGAIAAVAFSPAKPKPVALPVQPSQAVTDRYTRNARALFSRSGRGDDVFKLPPDPVYDGTLLPHGGMTVEITDSSGVSWSFAESP
jgi:hypothetical protein